MRKEMNDRYFPSGSNDGSRSLKSLRVIAVTVPVATSHRWIELVRSESLNPYASQRPSGDHASPPICA